MRSLLRAGVVSCLILAVQFSSSNASASVVAPVAASVTAGATTAGAGIAGDKATSVAPNEKPRLRMRVVRRFGKHDGYVVQVRYPQFSGTPTDLVLQLNRDIRRHVDMNVPATGNEYTAFRYSCDFETFLVTPDAVSILFVFEDNLQGAHPGTRTASFNRQLYPQYKTLRLGDLVRRPVDYDFLESHLTPVDYQYLEAHGGRAQYQHDQNANESTHALTCGKSDLAPSDFANFTFNQKLIQFNFPEGRFGVPFQQDDAQIELSHIGRVVPPTSPIYRYVRRAQR